MKKLRVDLNADLGEGSPNEPELLRLVSSANIACGFHAGDPASIGHSIRAAHVADVAIGAHPSLADRENFGRLEMPITADEAFALVTYQLGAFAALAKFSGAPMRHVKPHGALYNMASRDPALATAIAKAVRAIDASLILFAPGKSALARAGETLGLRVAHEVFADRNYLPNGSLVPRSRTDALLREPDDVAERVLRMLREKVVRAVDGTDIGIEADTICLHGDGADALAFAKTLRAVLAAAAVEVAPPFA